MKKCWILGTLVVFLLTGCAEEPLETVSDVYLQPIEALAQQALLELPPEAAQPVMESDSGEKLYQCNGYELRLQTLPSGNFTGTLRTVTGFSEEDLTVMQTVDGENTRYDCVWCTASEEGQLVGRTAIVDDGNYYYCLSAMANADEVGQLQETWQQLFASFTLG